MADGPTKNALLALERTLDGCFPKDQLAQNEIQTVSVHVECSVAGCLFHTFERLGEIQERSEVHEKDFYTF